MLPTFRGNIRAGSNPGAFDQLASTARYHNTAGTTPHTRRQQGSIRGPIQSPKQRNRHLPFDFTWALLGTRHGELKGVTRSDLKQGRTYSYHSKSSGKQELVDIEHDDHKPEESDTCATCAAYWHEYVMERRATTAPTVLPPSALLRVQHSCRDTTLLQKHFQMI